METSNINHGGSSILQNEYVSRINRVIDHIETNIDRDLSLETLAAEASFSPFHFHRIFKAMMGETLRHFIQRVRIEKAAVRLIKNPNQSITEIAFDCGFSGSASFARAFKETFHMSASQYRIGNQASNDENSRRNILSRINYTVTDHYLHQKTNNPVWRIQKKSVPADSTEVEVKEMPDFHVAYVRYIGPYKGDFDLFQTLFGKLMKWATPRGLLHFPETKMFSVYHDNPEVTSQDNLRVSICINVPKDTRVDGEIGKMMLPGGQFSVARFSVSADAFEDAWDLVCGGWLPQSGFQPDDRLSYEICWNDPNTHPEKKHVVDICLPVKPL